ncbi:hypothetical protein QJS04_geneDACA021441 [Acorus gramineus]|uniref:Sulfotransferase n=1 Tax=Acorus gramineus TaxID=55184 RepID=A0AAV9B7V9_ACOGR|nr:hypothetical protein QJS04_geneDACA021441 [Acorus gramineus]
MIPPLTLHPNYGGYVFINTGLLKDASIPGHRSPPFAKALRDARPVPVSLNLHSRVRLQDRLPLPGSKRLLGLPLALHQRRQTTDLPLDRAIESFVGGATPCGPFWDQAMGYYKESLESPKRVLFMRYEELHKDPFGELKRLAEFVGCPFTEEEERGGVVGEIVEMCGFERLVGLEVNKRGKMEMGKVEVENRVFFRKGRVEDLRELLD